MTTSDQELEVKFYLNDLQALEKRLQALGARLVQPREHETNLRFDTEQGDLTRASQVLRLRQDSQVRITYKGPGRMQQGVKARTELEVAVSDFDTAWAILEALGYVVSVMYEKFRATYDLDNVHVTLDELPYGRFAEIEGPDGHSIYLAAEKLGLPWQTRIFDSYLVLFENARKRLGVTGRDLNFANFEGIHASAADLGVNPADPVKSA